MQLRDELMAANIYVAGPYKVGEHRLVKKRMMMMMIRMIEKGKEEEGEREGERRGVEFVF